MMIRTNAGRGPFRGADAGSKGIVLIDALIAIVIFSIGILGIVALQSNAISLSSNAQYRTEAAMLADKVIGEMWGSDPATLATTYVGAGGTGGAKYSSWNTLVQVLPGGVGSIVVGNAGIVTVTVGWTQPGDPAVIAGAPVAHEYTSVTQVAY